MYKLLTMLLGPDRQYCKISASADLQHLNNKHVSEINEHQGQELAGT
jgi:hypothetical protein